MRNILCRFVLFSVLLLTGCQKTPRAEARSELAELGLEFTQGAYIDAVDGGDAVVVELFLAAGMSQNLVYSSGKTVLIRAAEEGQPVVVEKLLEAGARIETWDDEGWNALMRASWNGHVEVVRLLLDAGADINSRKKGRYTIMLSDPYEFNQGGTPLLAAVANNEEVMATSLLESGADFSLRDAQGLSALDVAAQNGFLEIVKALLSVGAEVNAKGTGGLTPIYRASNRGRTNVIELLLDSGADPNVAINNGGSKKSPLLEQ